MNPNLTEIIFLLDRSGSMSHIADDTIGGYNSFIEKQKNEPGEARLTTVLFDDQYELLHDAVPLQDVQPLTRDTYFARGMTALMDAVGRTINSVGERLATTPEDERPSKVIFVITTDGLENYSREFDRQRVKNMIEHQTTKYSWQFMFLGANIDAAGEAESIGISRDYAANYAATDIGTDALFTTMSATVSDYRIKGAVDGAWASSLDACNGVNVCQTNGK